MAIGLFHKGFIESYYTPCKHKFKGYICLVCARDESVLMKPYTVVLYNLWMCMKRIFLVWNISRKVT